jgi:hypothetical protein
MYTATLAIDNILDPTSVPLATEMTARELIEAAFVQLQTDANPDPFTLTIAYYGYDHYNGVTTYLGYFIVSISQTTGQGTKKYASDANNYWQLFVNGNLSTDGMDSVLVEPGDQVELKWGPAGPAAKQPSARLQRVLARRPS